MIRNEFFLMMTKRMSVQNSSSDGESSLGDSLSDTIPYDEFPSTSNNSSINPLPASSSSSPPTSSISPLSTSAQRQVKSEISKPSLFGRRSSSSAGLNQSYSYKSSAVTKRTKRTPVVQKSTLFKFFSKYCLLCDKSHVNQDNWCTQCQGGKILCGPYKNRSFRWMISRKPEVSLQIYSKNNDPVYTIFRQWILLTPSAHTLVAGPTNQQQQTRQSQQSQTQQTQNPGRDMLLPHGKYKGRSYAWVFAHDLQYCQFIIDMSNAGREMRVFQRWLKHKFAI